MRSQDEVYAVLALQLGGFVGGPDAPGEGHLLHAALATQAAEFPEVSADAVHGVLADVACVDDDEVCLFVALNLGVAGVEDHAPHAVRVVDVHLAAEGPYARGLADALPTPRRSLGPSGELYRDQGPYGRPSRLTHTPPPARRRGLSR